MRSETGSHWTRQRLRPRFNALRMTAVIMAIGMGAPFSRAEDVPPVTVREIESTNFDADFSPGEATTNVEAELEEIYGDNENYLESFGGTSPLDLLVNPFDELYRKTGLRLGVAYTALWLQPIGGRSPLSGAGGDLDFLSSWTLLGRGTRDTGRLVFTGEYRHTIGDQPPSRIGGQMGTLIPPVNAFNDREWVVRDAYWIQRLFDARLRLLIGRADPSDYVGAHWLQNVNNSFANRSFSANPAIPFPGHGPLAGVSLRPTDEFYLTAGACNGYSLTTEVGLDTLFDDWDLFSFAEVGYTPTFKSLGVGRYAFGLWHMDQRDRWSLPEDYGFTMIADQNLTETLQVFARYAYSDGTLTNIRQLAQLGFGLSGLLGRADDLTGLAYSLADPVSTDTRYENTLEVFHRFQVTQNTQFSVGLQLIANPVNSSGSETAGTFYARLRTSF